MQITLLRHGKPEFELTGTARACDLNEIARSYDLCGITDKPPSETVMAAKKHKVVVCSVLPRSLQSANALGFTKIHSATSLFNETSIPHFSQGSVKLPINIWIVLLRILWLCGFSKNGESITSAKQRGKLAAQELIKLAERNERVLLVGHGLINHFIAKELLDNDWIGPKRSGRNYWEYSIYRYHSN